MFFRRYGLQDAWTVFLNWVLLFVVLFYVYPLKFLTMPSLGEFGGDPPPQILQEAGSRQSSCSLYSGGVVLIFGCSCCCYRHAWRKRGALELDATDAIDAPLQHARAPRSARRWASSRSALVSSTRERGYVDPRHALRLMGPLHGWNGYMAAGTRSCTSACRSAS